MNLKDIKFIPIKRADYGTKINGIPLMNFPEYRTWMQKYWGTGVSRKMFNKGCNLTGDNREKFKKLFGKRNFTFVGNHFYHAWIADLGTAKLAIFTAKDHGTSYEVIEYWNNKKTWIDINKVFEFLDMIANIA